MQIFSNRELLNPFVFHGLWVIVVPSSPHGIRIFYDFHVYEVILTDNELKDWIRCGTEWQRNFIKTLLAEQLMNGTLSAVKRNSSIEDGYLA